MDTKITSLLRLFLYPLEENAAYVELKKYK